MRRFYGQRYLRIRDFVSHCSNLNFKVDEGELDFYEKEGYMLPVVQIVKPEDFVIAKDRYQSGREESEDFSRWSEMKILEEKFYIYPEEVEDVEETKSHIEEVIPVKELIPDFDKALDEKNPYIEKVSTSNYKNPDEYQIEVETEKGDSRRLNRVEKYYSYWQVYQLALIKQYPDIYQNKRLISNLRKDFEYKPTILNIDIYRNFEGLANVFDGISFWRELYNELSRITFDDAKNHSGVYILNEEELQVYLRRLKEATELVFIKNNFDSDQLIVSLRSLIELLIDYEKSEKVSLSRDLENDISQLANLVSYHEGKDGDWETVSAKLVEKNIPTGTISKFRNIAPTLRYRDGALEHMKYIQQSFRERLGENKFDTSHAKLNEGDLVSFVNYCQNHNLLLMLRILDRGVWTSEEDGRTGRLDKLEDAIGLINSFESLIRQLTQGVDDKFPNLLHKLLQSQPDLRKTISTEISESGGPMGVKSTEDFFQKLQSLFSKNYKIESKFLARWFLVTYLSRNALAHGYSIDYRFDADIYRFIYQSVTFSIFYSWKIAIETGLIQV